MGRVNISMVNPGSQPVNSYRIMAIPETPPGAILNGAKKMSKLIARIIEPPVSRQ
jgi:hypothetical protein